MPTQQSGLLKLPDVLRDQQLKFVHALAQPVPGSWSPENTFMHALQPEAIASVLVGALHLHLVNAQIAYLFREKMRKNDKVVLAKASRAGGKIEFLADVDLLIEVNWEHWRFLNGEQRIALMDHELQHFQANDDQDGYVVIGHDIEEFSAIVRRWGLWQMDLQMFARAIEAGPQLTLFAKEQGDG